MLFGHGKLPGGGNTSNQVAIGRKTTVFYETRTLKISRECGFFWAFLPHFRETRMVYRSKGLFFLALYLNALFLLVPLKGLHHAAFGYMHLSDGWRSLCCLRAAISTHATRSLRLHHELHGFTQGAPSCSFVLWLPCQIRIWHGSQSKLASL